MLVEIISLHWCCQQEQQHQTLYVSFSCSFPSAPVWTASGYITLRAMRSQKKLCCLWDQPVHRSCFQNKQACSHTHNRPPPPLLKVRSFCAMKETITQLLSSSSRLCWQGLKPQRSLCWPEVQPCHQDVQESAESERRALNVPPLLCLQEIILTHITGGKEEEVKRSRNTNTVAEEVNSYIYAHRAW